MLAKTLLRMLTIQVLMEVPSLRQNIEDSLIVPLDEGKDADWPEIAAIVYTEVLERQFDNSKKPHVDLIIDLLAGVEGVFNLDDGEQVIIPQVMNAKAELHCDLVEDDITAALKDTSNDWAEIWRRFATVNGTVKSYCGSDAKGKKRALRRIVFPVDVFNSPTRGKALTGAWADAITKLEADGLDHYKPVAALIRKVLEGQGDVSDWVAAVEQTPLDRTSAYILGLTIGETESRTSVASIHPEFTVNDVASSDVELD
nr:hypothetical protein [uncultured Cohaesibacter sp.]